MFKNGAAARGAGPPLYGSQNTTNKNGGEPKRRKKRLGIGAAGVICKERKKQKSEQKRDYVGIQNTKSVFTNSLEAHTTVEGGNKLARSPLRWWPNEPGLGEQGKKMSVTRKEGGGAFTGRDSKKISGPTPTRGGIAKRPPDNRPGNRSTHPARTDSPKGAGQGGQKKTK